MPPEPTPPPAKTSSAWLYFCAGVMLTIAILTGGRMLFSHVRWDPKPSPVVPAPTPTPTPKPAPDPTPGPKPDWFGWRPNAPPGRRSPRRCPGSARWHRA